MSEPHTESERSQGDDAHVLIDHLREAREKRGWSLEDLSDRTRISIDVLSNLEAGNLSVVETPYVRAFLRTYAKAVGVPIDEVNAAFPEPKVPMERPRDRTETPTADVFRPRIPWGMIAFIVIVIGALAVVWVWRPWRSTGPQPGQLPSITPGAPARPDTTPATTPSDTARRSATAGLDTVSSMPRPGEEPVLRALGAPTSSSRPPTGATAGRRTLAIAATDTVWVEVIRGRDDTLFQDRMAPGTRRQWPLDDTLHVTVGRYWAAKVLVDGREVAIPHGRQSVARFTSTPTGVVLR